MARKICVFLIEVKGCEKFFYISKLCIYSDLSLPLLPCPVPTDNINHKVEKLTRTLLASDQMPQAQSLGQGGVHNLVLGREIPKWEQDLFPLAMHVQIKGPGQLIERIRYHIDSSEILHVEFVDVAFRKTPSPIVHLCRKIQNLLPLFGRRNLWTALSGF